MKHILFVLRKDSRCNLSLFSKINGYPLKRVHYEFSKLKRKNIKRFVSFVDFEKLGFVRFVVFFNNASDGLFVQSSFKSYFVNNSSRLDSGLFLECVFFSLEDSKEFFSDLSNKGVSYDYFPVLSVLKQESFIL